MSASAQVGPGQGDPLFPWLAEEASRDELRWFFEQEAAGEAGFEGAARNGECRVYFNNTTPVTSEELYDQAHAANAGPAWDQLTDEQKHKAVMDFVRQCADIARAVQKESDV